MGIVLLRIYGSQTRPTVMAKTCTLTTSNEPPGTVVIRSSQSSRTVNMDGALNCLAVSWTSSVQFPKRHTAYSPPPSWGPAVDADGNAFVERPGYWIRRFGSQSLGTERYFGTEGLEVKRHSGRLLPNVNKSEATPMEVQSDADSIT